MAEKVALVRRPSGRMADGITTHIDRVPADAGLAVRQHEAYVDAVAGCGWTVREVAPAAQPPDSAVRRAPGSPDADGPSARSPRPTICRTARSSRTPSSCSATWRC